MSTEKEYEFLFAVDGVSMDDDEAVAILADAFDGVLSWNRGLYRLAVSGEGSDAMDAVGKLLSRITSVLPELRILRLDPDLVGIPDIAQRIGHTRQNIQQWVNGERNGSRPFPPPEGCAGRSLVWRWADVNEWLKPLGLCDEAARLSREDAARVDVIVLDWNRTHSTRTAVQAAGLTWQRSDSDIGITGLLLLAGLVDEAGQQERQGDCQLTGAAPLPRRSHRAAGCQLGPSIPGTGARSDRAAGELAAPSSPRAPGRACRSPTPASHRLSSC